MLELIQVANQEPGLMIDNKLTWRPHIDYVYSKLLKFTGIFYKLRWPCE